MCPSSLLSDRLLTVEMPNAAKRRSLKIGLAVLAFRQIRYRLLLANLIQALPWNLRLFAKGRSHDQLSQSSG